MNECKVSIIVPVYNTDKYLKKCLDSIANQTLCEIEAIVVDDGSTDSSSQICDQYLNDSRFKIYHRDNHGVSDTRNFGLQKASGVYCMFVDSDDWLEEKACELLYQYAVKTNVDLVIGGHVNEATAGSTNRYIYTENCVFHGEDYRQKILTHTLGLTEQNLKNPDKLDKLTPVWSRIYRTEIIKKYSIGYIELNRLPSECLQFNFEFCINAKSAAFLHSIVYHYRRNTVSSVTKPYRNDLWEKWKWWILYMEQYLTRANADDYLWKAFHSRVCCSVIPLGGNALKLKKYRDIKNEVKSVLNQHFYSNAWENFDYSYCPFYWKLFFWSAKNKYYSFFILLTWCMRKILDFRKK